MALHVKKDDMVQVITGDYKGATGKVLRVLCDENKVIVQGIIWPRNTFGRREEIPRAGG